MPRATRATPEEVHAVVFLAVALCLLSGGLVIWGEEQWPPVFLGAAALAALTARFVRHRLRRRASLANDAEGGPPAPP